MHICAPHPPERVRLGSELLLCPEVRQVGRSRRQTPRQCVLDLLDSEAEQDEPLDVHLFLRPLGAVVAPMSLEEADTVLGPEGLREEVEHVEDLLAVLVEALLVEGNSQAKALRHYVAERPLVRPELAPPVDRADIVFGQRARFWHDTSYLVGLLAEVTFGSLLNESGYIMTHFHQ